MSIKDNYLWRMDLVTGATGIVGRELLAQLLASGTEVRALRRESSDIDGVEKFIRDYGVDTSGLNWVYGDTRDINEMLDAVRGCDRVFHVAALVSFTPSDSDRMMDINRGGTANVVNAMLDSGVKDLIYVSSVAAIGYTSERAIDEDVPFEDGPLTTAYSRSKYLSELEVWRGSEEGLDVVIVNPSIIIGPGDFSRSSGELFSQIHRGTPFYLAGMNGFVSAKDVAKACVTLAEENIRGEKFLLNAENKTYKEAMQSIAESLNVKPPKYAVRDWMVGLVWRGFYVVEKLTGHKALATKESLKMSQLDTRYDGSKIKRHLSEIGKSWGYEPIETAVKRTSEVYLASLN
jgi:nucleoside-diphosphate-sugar epimerase